MRSFSGYAPVVLRLGLAAVFFWFGFTQIFDQSGWTGLIPAWITSLTGMSAETIVLFNGIAEVIGAFLLACGFYTRIVAALLALHLLTIIFDVGLGAVGVRDAGLMFALISVALAEPDTYTADVRFRRI